MDPPPIPLNVTHHAHRPRERNSCRPLANGYANKEIADQHEHQRLPTVRTSSCGTVYEKLHVRSRTEAVVKYLK